MKSRLIYVGNIPQRIRGGADVCNTNIIELLSSMKKDVIFIDPFSYGNKYRFGYCYHLLQDIFKIIDDQCEAIVFSSSLLGYIAEVIKKKYPRIPLITCFHNIERHYAWELLISDGIKHLPFYLAVLSAEKKMARFTDYPWVFNDRDNALLQKYYHRQAALVSFFGIKDSYQDNALPQYINQDCPTFLFLGSGFYANQQAVRWFLKKVLPFVRGRLIVAGNGMDEVLNDIQNERVTIKGYINDVSVYYKMADFVISPIFNGGGMKTKTAEALMYGKLIIGTKEAFEGFIKCDSMYECNTPIEFIQQINSLIQERKYNFSSSSRKLYQARYSYMAFKEKFNDFYKHNIRL